MKQTVKKVKKLTIETLGRKQYFTGNSQEQIHNRSYQETEDESSILEGGAINMDTEVVLKLELRNRDTKIEELESRKGHLENVVKTTEEKSNTRQTIMQQNLIVMDD